MEAKKQFGQHFLINETVAQKIAERCKTLKILVEVGPGKGALTEKLINFGLTVVGVELDKDLLYPLKNRFRDRGNFYIVNGDASYFKIRKEVAVCGNLPYNSAKPIIRNFISQRKFIPKMVFMVQKEVADTITAKPSTKEFSKFSVLCQLYYDTSTLFHVKPGSFRPAPKVTSSVVEFRRKNKFYDIDESFFKFLNVLFLHPRKTVKNNLKPFELNLDEITSRKRPSELNIDEIYQLWREKWRNQ